MKTFLKINKKIQELNDTEAYVFMRLVLGKFDKKVIHRKYLAVCLGVTNLDYITQILKRLEDSGFIYRPAKKKGDGKKVVFEIADCDSWFMLDLNVARARKDARLIGFALRYRAIALDDTLEVKFNKTKVAEVLKISRPTLNKNLTLLEENNMLPKDLYDKPTATNYLTPHNQKILNDMITLFGKNSREYKLGSWFIANQIFYQPNCNIIFNRIQAGIINKKPIKQTIVEVWSL